MKGILRAFVFSEIALHVTHKIMQNSFLINGGIETFIFSGFVLALLFLLLKPILKLLFFPINAMTLGLFSLVINGCLLFLLTKIIPNIIISAWTFPGINYFNLSIQPLALNIYVTILVAALIISLIINFFSYLVK